MLVMLDEALKKMNEYDSYGLWSVAGYFLSNDKKSRSCVYCRNLVLLLGIISPIVKSDISVGDLLSQTEIEENAEYDALMHTANLTEKKIREEMKEILINEGVNEYEIYVSTSVDAEKNTVYLEEIKIEVGNAFEDKIDKIKNSVPQEYGHILKVGVKNE